MFKISLTGNVEYNRYSNMTTNNDLLPYCGFWYSQRYALSSFTSRWYYKAQFYHNLLGGQYICARCNLFAIEIAPDTFTKAALSVNRCKRVSKKKCYLKMIIKCPKKKRCRDVEEDECENVPIRKCKPIKVKAWRYVLFTLLLNSKRIRYIFWQY